MGNTRHRERMHDRVASVVTVGLALAVTACGASPTPTEHPIVEPGAAPSAPEPGAVPGASEPEAAPGASEPEAAPSSPDYAALGFVEQDVSQAARESFTDFTGTVKLMAPSGLAARKDGLSMMLEADGFTLDILQDTHLTARIAEHIETAGRTDMCEAARIVEKGDGYLIFEGTCWNERGFHVRVDLDSIGEERWQSACLSEGWELTREQADRVLIACRSIDVENGPATGR
ncbi:MAG: hypothetical protein KC464_21035 [Myxococcales bacterium]|nr:hypothetical protein [Myxococcales bacterium]